MATIQLGNTKVATKLISYAEKRATERGGIDCPAEYAKAQFKATRELWGKTEGIQAHHVIQSFKPGEVTPKMANEIGQDLARNIAKGHEAVVYTHTDKDHIHNHIVINAVSFENGSKYQSAKKDLYKIREQSDQLCLSKGLSIVKEPTAQIRYTLDGHLPDETTELYTKPLAVPVGSRLQVRAVTITPGGRKSPAELLVR